MFVPSPIIRLSLLGALLLLCGCASDGIFAHRDVPCIGDDCIGPQFVQFERGQPNVVVDSVGWVFGIPNRILLWNWDVQNHDISVETEQELRQYVAGNGLQDVKVRLNQYDPGGEWQRLAENKRVGAGWRYTVGALTTLGYTVLPGRLFAADYYNPFTNTVNVYSDVPALGMKGAAYARDVIDRDLPGTYAFSQFIPGVNLVHETITTRDVLDYVHDTGNLAMKQESVHVLYPNYGGSVGGAVDAYVPATYVFRLGGAVVGHVAGRWETRGWGVANQPMLSGTESISAPAVAATPAAAEPQPAAVTEEGALQQVVAAQQEPPVEPRSDETTTSPGASSSGNIVTAGYEEPAGNGAER